VLIADDHPVVRKGVRSLLREHPAFGEPREAATTAETLAMVEAEPLDVVVMNTTLLDADSLEVLRRIKALRPELPVILLHPEPDPAFARAALAGGAAGIVTKAEHEDELLKAIEAALAAKTYLGAAIAARMNGENHLN
jgi:DNA-binding NarL/FixJ family response regulator